MKEKTLRLTVAQALLRYLQSQWVAWDDSSQPFFAGMWGIFGHGNVTGIGQALEENKEFPFYLARNEQGMVHAAAAFAKQNRRKKTFACTTSIGPGATNMITAAAGATINRLPVLLLPGDTFVKRTVGPVLQQLESPQGPQISVNDCFIPISRFWDRIQHPHQLLTSLPEMMRVLVDPAETGTVTLCLPQDIQTWAGEFPQSFFEKKVHYIPRPLPDQVLLLQAAALLREAQCPLIIAGGGLLYAEGENALIQFCEQTGMAVAETQAGSGSLPWDFPNQLGAIGVTGTWAANTLAKEADVVLCVGTRLSDFTTASKTQFQNPRVKFINININAQDAHKQGALPLVGDAKATLEALGKILADKSYRTGPDYFQKVAQLKARWEEEKAKIFSPSPHNLRYSQGEVLKTVNSFLGPQDTIVGAAGSLPGDMHKLLQLSNGDQYQMEYGYSCMGHEISGGLGVKLAKKEGEVFVMVGDGSFLMMPTELLTSLQEKRKLIVILIENHCFASIDHLSKSCGSQGFGNEFRSRDSKTGQLSGPWLPVDFLGLSESLGAKARRIQFKQNQQNQQYQNAKQNDSKDELIEALLWAKTQEQTVVIVVEVDPTLNKVPSYNTWWDVPIAEVSQSESVREARRTYEEKVKEERIYFGVGGSQYE